MPDTNKKFTEEFDPRDNEPVHLRALGDELAVESPPTESNAFDNVIPLRRGHVSDILGTKEYRRYGEAGDITGRTAGKLYAGAAVASALVYLLWFWTVVSWQDWYISIPFFIIEIVGLFAFALFAFIVRAPRRHDPAGQHWDQKPPVDIFIATCDEPLDVLAPTVRAATRIEYNDKQVYILDDSANPAVQRLAQTFGCRYLSRAENVNAKAGNLNYALEKSERALILALDADQVPEPDILKNTVGYFKFPEIAFVQTAQRFRLPEGDPFGNSDELFYQVMQPGKDHDNAAFSCGSGVVYRRSALESIGGFSTWNLVEDLHTSMLLHAAGWKSIYHDHPLSTGLAPSDITQVYKQRGQWAIDSLRLFFWDNPFKHRGLSLRQKLQYFGIGFSYLQSALVMPLFFILPSWSLLTGTFPITAPLTEYALYRGVYLLLTLLATSSMRHPPSSSKSYRIWAGLFPVHFKAMVKALVYPRSKPAYKVNNKTGARSNFPVILKSVFWQAAIMALTVSSITYRALDAGNKLLDLFILNLAWGFFILWSLSWICHAALKPVKWPNKH